MDWREVRDKIRKEADRIQVTPPDEVVRLFKYNIIPTGQGGGGQAFTTMVFCEGDCRALAYYNVLCLVRMVEEPSFTLDQLKIMFRDYVPLSAEFQGTCGLMTLWNFVQDMLAVLDDLKTKDEFRELLDALSIYVAVLHAWVHNLFPWYIGELFPQRKAEDVKEMDRLLRLP